MEIIKNYTTNNPCYKVGKTITVKGLMLHSIGCAQSKASVLVNNYDKDIQACVHGFVDADTGNVHMTLPTLLTEDKTSIGWHSGSGSKGKAANANNSGYIGIEMCESTGIKYVTPTTFKIVSRETYEKHRETAYRSTVQLFAKLCWLYKLNPFTDIISHKEGNALGIASNHSDPEHYWLGSHTMDTFREAVADELSVIKGNNEATETDKIQPGTIVRYTGWAYAEPVAVAMVAKGSYTIVETRDIGGHMWGKLKSGIGWIPLE